jgi:tRNA pseudouridine55 synthase
LAHDFGQLLGTGAYLSSLIRTQIGDFKLEDAFTIEELDNHIKELSKNKETPSN